MRILLDRFFPFVRCFPVERASLRADFIAGLTVAFILIPQSMAYAELAGLPPWVGLYAAFLPVVLGGLWGSSDHLQTGPVAMISLLTASVLGSLAVTGSSEFILLASKLAFMIGVMWMLIALFRLVFMINFVSRPVIEGFIHAAAVIIATSQLGKVLGLSMVGGEHYLGSLWSMLGDFGEVHWVSCLLGGGALIILLLGRRFCPRVPVALGVVGLGAAVVYLFGLSDPQRVARPLEIVGKVPLGLPHPVFAVPVGREFFDLLPGALTIAFVGFMEMTSITRALAVRSRQKLNFQQEVVGQALASFGSAFSGGFPISGSFSRSALNFSVGSRSRLSAVFTGLSVMVFLLFFTRFLFYVPKTVLAAIIISAVIHLMNFGKLWHFFVVNKADGIASFATFIATLFLAPHLEQGILLGASLSILIHLYRIMRPHVVLLGTHPNGTLRDAALHGLEVDQNLPALRLDERLVFANSAFFEETIYHTREQFPEARYLAIVCDGINEIDVSGTEMLKDTVGHLRHHGVELLLIGVKTPVMEVIKTSGLDQRVGTENIFPSYELARKEVYSRLPSDITYSI